MTALVQAFKSIMANKVRTFLTSLGIIIGTFSLFVLLAVGEGAGEAMQDTIRSLGSNIIMILPAPGMRFRARKVRFDEEDFLALKALDEAKQVVGYAEKTAIVGVGGRKFASRVKGIYGDYFRAMNLKLIKGRYLDYFDYNSTDRVVVIGSLLARRLFKEEDPIGKLIDIDGVKFEVVGVVDRESATFSLDNSSCFVGFKTFVAVWKIPFFNVFVLIARNEADVDALQNEAIRALYSRWGEDFIVEYDVLNQQELLSTMEKIGDIFKFFLGVVASISLIVGGIGIMNIMLVSVAERTREIGIRRAIGATKFNILVMFILEAVALSLVGAVVGLILGWWAVKFVDKLGYAVSYNWGQVIVATLFPVVVGVVFGFFPAWRAACLNVVEALRYE